MKEFAAKAVTVVLVGLVVLIPTALLVALSTLVRGLVLQKLWTWFVVSTFNAPQLGVCAALGLALLVNYATWQNAVTNKIEGEGWKPLLTGLFQLFGTPLMVLAMGWVIHLFQ